MAFRTPAGVLVLMLLLGVHQAPAQITAPPRALSAWLHARTKAGLTNSDRAELKLLGAYVAAQLQRQKEPQSTQTIANVVRTLVPALSAANVNTLSQYLQDELDSDNEVSEMTSMQLQMLMDSRSKLLQTASDIEKSEADAEAAIVQNLKQ